VIPRIRDKHWDTGWATWREYDVRIVREMVDDLSRCRRLCLNDVGRVTPGEYVLHISPFNSPSSERSTAHCEKARRVGAGYAQWEQKTRT
jgi:hypothetical protein